MPEIWILSVTRRALIKAFGLCGVTSLAYKTMAGSLLFDQPRSNAFYFDSKNGLDASPDDLNHGRTPTTPFRGLPGDKATMQSLIAKENSGGSKNIELNLAYGSVFHPPLDSANDGLKATSVKGLTIKGYGDRTLPMPRIDCTVTLQHICDGSPEELFINSNKNNFYLLRVPLTVAPPSNAPIQRLWAPDLTTEIAEAKIVDRSKIVSQNDAIQLLIHNISEIKKNDSKDSYWYCGTTQEYHKPQLYIISKSRRLLSQVNAFTALHDGYGGYGVHLLDCKNFYITDIEFFGASRQWLRIDGGYGTVNNIRFRRSNIQNSSGIGIYGTDSKPVEFVFFKNIFSTPEMSETKLRELRSDHQVRPPVIEISGNVKMVSISKSMLHNSIHAAIHCPPVTANNGFSLRIEDTNITSCKSQSSIKLIQQQLSA